MKGNYPNSLQPRETIMLEYNIEGFIGEFVNFLMEMEGELFFTSFYYEYPTNGPEDFEDEWNQLDCFRSR